MSVAEGQDRVLTLPWTRTSSRRRREIIQRVGEAQQPLRAMRTYRPKNHLGTNRAICSITDPKADLLAPGRERAPTSWVEPITTPVMPTSPVMTGFPCVIAQRDEPAQRLNVRVHRPRLKVDQDSSKRRPRGWPIVSTVVQQPLRIENHSVCDLGNPDHGASHVFSPARVTRLRPQTRRR